MEPVPFPLTGGNQRPCSARLYESATRGRDYALFVHTLPGPKGDAHEAALAGALERIGLSTLAVRMAPLVLSRAEGTSLTLPEDLGDVAAYVEAMHAQGWKVRVLIGHSTGGASVLHAARSVPEAEALVVVGTPFGDAALEKAPRADDGSGLLLGGEQVEVPSSLIAAFRELSLEPLDTAGKSLLVVHALEDEIVSSEEAESLFRRAPQPKSFVALEGASHFFRRPVDGVRFAEVVARFVALRIEPAIRPTPTGIVEVTGGREGYRHRIRAGAHELLVDEPVELGGTDTGPNPYDLLLAALGSCTAITLRMYADRKGISLEGVKVTLAQRRIHVRDCEDCEQDEGMVTEITTDLELEGPLDDAERARLLAIAERCPVHKTLKNEVIVRTREGEREV